MEASDTGVNIEPISTQEANLAKAGVSTIEALRGHLSDTLRNQYEGVLENINGARGYLTKKGLQLTFALSTSIAMITACAPVNGVLSNPPLPDLGGNKYPIVEVQFSEGVPAEVNSIDLQATAENPFPYAAIEQSQEFSPDEYYTGDAIEYDGSAAYIINEVKEKYGISIMSPTEWNGEINRPWNPVAIQYVAKAIRGLPEAYLDNSRAPLQILLFSLPSQDEALKGGLTAGYGHRQITISVPETFDPMAPTLGTYNLHFGSQELLLEAFVIHEFTHAFTEAHPEVLENWIKMMGWEWDGKNWTNKNPSLLINESHANNRPVEDIAVSASLLWSNPIFLSQDRIDFFKSNPNFINWMPIKLLASQ